MNADLYRDDVYALRAVCDGREPAPRFLKAADGPSKCRLVSKSLTQNMDLAVFHENVCVLNLLDASIA
jgi:hypothetical protein